MSGKVRRDSQACVQDPSYQKCQLVSSLKSLRVKLSTVMHRNTSCEYLNMGSDACLLSTQDQKSGRRFDLL